MRLSHPTFPPKVLTLQQMHSDQGREEHCRAVNDVVWEGGREGHTPACKSWSSQSTGWQECTDTTAPAKLTDPLSVSKYYDVSLLETGKLPQHINQGWQASVVGLLF